MKTALQAFSALTLAVSLTHTGLAHAQEHQHDTFNLLEQEKANTQIYNAYFPNADIGRKAAISFHGQLLESHYPKGYLVMELNDEEMQKLQVFGFTFAPATEFITKRNQILSKLQTQMLSAQQKSLSMAADVSANNVSISGIPGYSCYATVEETFAVAADMASSKPNLAQWLDIGDSWEKGAGVGGHDLRVLKLTNRSKTGTKPKLFINSAIHAVNTPPRR